MVNPWLSDVILSYSQETLLFNHYTIIRFTSFTQTGFFYNMNLNHRLVFLILLCLSICGRLHGNPHAFKVLSEFIDRNSNLKTDDVTGERLATKRDVTNQDKEKTFDGRSDEAKVEEGREESNLSQNNFIKDTSNEAEQETEALIGRDDDVTFSRIRLPKFDDVKVNQTFSTFLPGEIEASVKVLSISPFIFGEFFFFFQTFLFLLLYTFLVLSKSLLKK